MSEIMEILQSDFMQSVKEKIDKKYEEINPSFSDSKLSNLIFRGEINHKNTDFIAAHIQSIKTQLDRIYNDDRFKRKEVLLEFSKSITLFDQFTKALNIEGGTYGDNFIASRNFYQNAVEACMNSGLNVYQGSMEFSCIPLKLRLAIEIHFKNMIGYKSASQKFLTGKRKGSTTLYPLSIADLLNFLTHTKYKKYCTPPIDIEILKDINFWSNNLIHTGVISFAWQNLQAIEFLKPLFSIKLEDGRWSLEGFNYLSTDAAQQDLENDLNEFLSNHLREISIKLFKFSNKPIEGEFYYRRKNNN